MISKWAQLLSAFVLSWTSMFDVPPSSVKGLVRMVRSRSFVGSFGSLPAGGIWKVSPLNACSVKCYNAVGAEVALDTHTQWDGVTQSVLPKTTLGLHLGSYDTLNTY